MSDSALDRRNFLRRAALAASTLGGAALVTPLAGCGNDATAPPAGNPPAAPTNLSATDILATQATLQWVDAASDEIVFEIQRRPAGGTFALRATAAADQTHYTDPGLTPETTYDYRVRALGERGASAFTPTLTLTTAAAPTGSPNAPTDLAAADLARTSVRLTWQDNSSDETGFRVEAQAGGDFASRAVLPAAATQYLADNLAPDTTYAFRVLALNEAGASAPTNVVTVRTGAAADLVTVDPGPTPGALLVRWVDRTGGGVGFRVERKVGAGEFTTLTTVAAGITTHQDDALTPGQAHAYRVVAEGLLALTADPVSIDVPELPGVPQDFVVAAAPDNGQQLRATWAAGPGGAPTAYQLERRQPPGNFAALDLGADPAVTTFLDTTTAPLTNYAYRVRAANLAGVSDYATSATLGTRAVFTAASVAQSGSGTVQEVLTTVGKGCVVRVTRPPRDFGSACGGSFSLILLIRESETVVRALLGHCTHQCFTPPTLFYQESQQVIHCNAHGSEFELNGAVRFGPAGSPLPSFQTQLFPERIEIYRA